jgi:hypothetical protein
MTRHRGLDVPSDLRHLIAAHAATHAAGGPVRRHADPGIRAAREAAGMTRAALAAACPALSLGAIQHYEQGTRRCPAVALAYVRERLAGRMVERGVVTTGDQAGAGDGAGEPDA